MLLWATTSKSTQLSTPRRVAKGVIVKTSRKSWRCGLPQRRGPITETYSLTPFATAKSKCIRGRRLSLKLVLRGIVVSAINQKRLTDRAVLKNIALIILKLAVTGTCFWYISRQVNLATTAKLAGELDLRWGALALLALCSQIPLAGVRLGFIFNALCGRSICARPKNMIAIAAIGIFFGQVLPNVGADAVRAWLLARSEYGWRLGIASVVIDRGVGIFVLLALGFAALLFPSALSALGGFRSQVLAVVGTTLAAGVLGFLAAPRVTQLLERWPSTQIIARFANAAYYALLGRIAIFILGVSLGIHLLTILAIWLLGNAQGLALPLGDAAVLFAIMTAISIIPISIGGWGLRELAVTALLQSHGFSPERALSFSVCFGLALLLAALPGAVVWAFYTSGTSIAREVLQP